jgi:hypothetical protein
VGPYTVEKLKALRARGQFSRVHEISTDQKNWSAAASLEELFIVPVAGSVSGSGPQQAIVASATTSPQTGGSTAARPAESPSVAAGLVDAGTRPGEPKSPAAGTAMLWYYRIDDEQFGPAETAELKKLIGEGRLGRGDIVWRDGLLDWLAVEEVPELIRGGLPPPVRKVRAHSSRLRWVVRAVIAIVISLAVVLVVYRAISG